MEYKKLNLIYFSATNTTKSTVESIAQGMGIVNIVKYDITKGQNEEITFSEEDIVIFGLPVYSGRVPAISVDSLNKFTGNNTPAIIVCVYGNRDYDDALLELRDIVIANGFSIVSAGAFIGQHSIFPQVGWSRPDKDDTEKTIDFGKRCIKLLENISDITIIPKIEVKGHFPYKIPKPVPLTPKGNRKCDACGKCVRNCPTHAIDIDTPRKTDKSLCIACARCIYVCPQKARDFRGIIYKLASRKFVKANAQRKEPEIILVN
ncbi:MAG: 4Fe-4S binding protein [Prevotella sp.]|jgi:ferredoxin|nr:4Fe-4S binding protein [Prevotella sp.]